MKVSASMLSADPTRLGEDLLAAARGGADAIHWDVMDGNYVDAITFGAHVIERHRKLTDIPFEVHLMVCNPDRHVSTFAECGADIIIIHPETCHHLHRTLRRIVDMGKKAGVALNPSTTTEFIEYCDGVLDMVLVMTVNPGYSGQSFLESQLKKISKLRKALPPKIEIIVDGGINASTAAVCRESGATGCVTGAFLFGHEDYKTAIQSLKR
ncbi:MAG: ribulose-phosphate 3-epimerase [Holosporaceae bacterium]|nr:ribulose-phosphate 3-epimerase [Holosporaceae bacterium]